MVLKLPCKLKPGNWYSYQKHGGYASDHTENVVGPRGIDMPRVKVDTDP